MGLHDWLPRQADDGPDDSGQWWSTASCRGHPDEGLFHYRLSSAPGDGALIGSWDQIAEAGSAGAWGPFPPYGGQRVEGPFEWNDTSGSDARGAEW